MTNVLATNLLDLLAGVEGERILGQTDLKVSVAKFGLAGLVKEDLAVVVAGHRVADHAVVTWWHHHHTQWRKEHSEREK